MTRSLVIGSRGSKLALWQSEHARTRLLQLNPNLEIRIEIIKTTGDVKSDPLSAIGGKGVFTKELEDALLGERIDLAVHSLKDLPTILAPGLAISAICEREDPRDALVLRAEHQAIRSLTDLAERPVVGTSSPRRVAQLKSLRPDVIVKELRGNVDTRVRKLDEGQYDALILASAGLVRLGLQDRISLRIPIQEMLPAVGQGAIAIETRSDDEDAVNAVNALNHPETRAACLAERSLLRNLGGGCQMPIAAHAVIKGTQLHLNGLVAKPDGSQLVSDGVMGEMNDSDGLGLELAKKLIARGATSLLAQS
jgi:hydroxymethylbilane synthase